MSEKTIKFYCTQEEYEQVLQNAYNKHKNVSDYIKEVTMNPDVINISYDAIVEHTETISALREELHQIITMIIQTKKAYPIDIKRIISLLEDVVETQKIMLELNKKEHQNAMKQIRKTLLK